MKLLIKNLLFTLFVPGTVAGLVPVLLTRDAAPAVGGWSIAATLLFSLGGAIYAWCVWDFATTGRGTPAPIDAPVVLVTRGLYCFTRNPMYVGVVTVILGWAALFRSPTMLLYAAAVAACFNAFIRLYEEPHLARVFGDEYKAYCGRVPRWLPGLRRR